MVIFECSSVFRKIMSAGATKPWREIVNATKLDGSAFLEYYAPLTAWLREENNINNITVGWHATDCKYMSGYVY